MKQVWADFLIISGNCTACMILPQIKTFFYTYSLTKKMKRNWKDPMGIISTVPSPFLILQGTPALEQIEGFQTYFMHQGTNIHTS